MEIKDSGERRQFESGAVRDIQEGKGRCDLMPLDVVAKLLELHNVDSDMFDIFTHLHKFKETGDYIQLLFALSAYLKFVDKSYADMLLDLSKHFEAGAKKYGENNWQKGIPVKCYIDSAVRHLLKFIRGDDDEPHDRAFCWNIMCCIWTCIHKPELNEYRKGVDNNGN